ncbi:unnamed protein product, partial [Didymodactylos carnosus]
MNVLFMSLTNAIGRINGKDLFKGYLLIAIRDVNASGGQGVLDESVRYVQELQNREQFAFLTKLFSEKCTIQRLNHFENTNFENEIEELRSSFIQENFKHWNPVALKEQLKILLVQLYADDTSNLDDIQLKMKIDSLYEEILNIWYDPSPLSKIPDKNFNYSTVFNEVQINIDFSQNELPISRDEISVDNMRKFEIFKNIFDKIMNFEITTSNYNAYWKLFDDVIVHCMSHRANLIEEYAKFIFKEKISKDKFDEEYEKVNLKLKHDLNEYKRHFKLCLEKCGYCQLRCLKIKNHSYEETMAVETKITKLKQLLDKTSNETEVDELNFDQLSLKLKAVDEQLELTETKIENFRKSIEISNNLQIGRDSITNLTKNIFEKESQFNESIALYGFDQIITKNDENIKEKLEQQILNGIKMKFLEIFALETNLPEDLKTCELEIIFSLLNEKLRQIIQDILDKFNTDIFLHAEFDNLYDKFNLYDIFIQKFEEYFNQLLVSVTDYIQSLNNSLTCMKDNENVFTDRHMNLKSKIEILQNDSNLIQEKVSELSKTRDKITCEMKVICDRVKIDDINISTISQEIETSKNAETTISTETRSIKNDQMEIKKQLMSLDKERLSLNEKKLTFENKFSNRNMNCASLFNTFNDVIQKAEEYLGFKKEFEVISHTSIELKTTISKMKAKIDANEALINAVKVDRNTEAEVIKIDNDIQTLNGRKTKMETLQQSAVDKLSKTQKTDEIEKYKSDLDSVEKSLNKINASIELKKQELENCRLAESEIKRKSDAVIEKHSLLNNVEYEISKLSQLEQSISTTRVCLESSANELKQLYVSNFEDLIKFITIRNELDSKDLQVKTYHDKLKTLELEKNVITEKVDTLKTDIKIIFQSIGWDLEIDTIDQIKELDNKILESMNINNEEKKKHEMNVLEYEKLKNETEQLLKDNVNEYATSQIEDKYFQLEQIESELKKFKEDDSERKFNSLKQLTSNVNELYLLLNDADESIQNMQYEIDIKSVDLDDKREEFDSLKTQNEKIFENYKETFIVAYAHDDEENDLIIKRLKTIENEKDELKIKSSQLENKLEEYKSKMNSIKLNDLEMLLSKFNRLTETEQSIQTENNQYSSKVREIVDDENQLKTLNLINDFIKRMITIIQIKSENMSNKIDSITKIHNEFNGSNKALAEIINTNDEIKKLENEKFMHEKTLEEIEKENPDYEKWLINKVELSQNIKLKEELEESKFGLKIKIDEFEDIKNSKKEISQLEQEIKLLQESINKACCCNTDHKCDQICQSCSNPEVKVPCFKSAGHEGIHICDKPQHSCTNNCEITGCPNKCSHPQGHENPRFHRCEDQHLCKEKCQYCSKQCIKSMTDTHSYHICDEKRCSKPCIFCGFGSRCVAEAHDHIITAEDVEILEKDSTDLIITQKHLCESKHKCRYKCGNPGVCEVIYSEKIKTWNTESANFQFVFLEPMERKWNCCKIIDVNEVIHSGEHVCEKAENHTCNAKCPDCSSYCNGMYGHVGEHSTISHRNKENCYFVTNDTQNIGIVAKDKSVRTYKSGEKSTPEICSESCARRGRSHYHLRRCLGEGDCVEKNEKFNNYGMHSKEKYKGFEEYEYDKYLCVYYWLSYDWLTPLKDEKLIQESLLCNCYCPHYSHKSEEKPSFCTREAWHTQ